MTSNACVSLPVKNGAKKLQIGWKYYNNIKKKAMESEFSWSGLILSISIAFFIVLITAYSLSLLHVSYQKTKINSIIKNNIYSLEKFHTCLNSDYFEVNSIDLSKFKHTNNTYLA